MDFISAIEGAIVLQGGKALIKGDVYKSMSQVLSVVGEETATITRNSFKYFNAERLAKVFIKVYLKLKENNVENPQAIASKILFPAIEDISIDKELENSETLQELWANLLVGEASGNSIPLDYFEIIKKLDSKDAKALRFIYNRYLNPRMENIDKYRNTSFESEYFQDRVEYICYFDELGYSDETNLPIRVELLEKYRLVVKDGSHDSDNQVLLSRIGINFMETATGIKKSA